MGNSERDDDATEPQDEPAIERRWRQRIQAMTPAQREQLKKAIRDAMPATTRLQNVSGQYRTLLNETHLRLRNTTRPLLPQLHSPVRGLLDGIDLRPAHQLSIEVGAWARQHARLTETIRSLGELLRNQFPANLRDLPSGALEDIPTLVVDEGIPVFGAPRREILEALLGAPDRHARRLILANRAEEISIDCGRVLDSCQSEWSRSRVRFAREALASLDEGRPACAQALAASIVDTLLRGWFGEQRADFTPSRASARHQRSPEVLEWLSLREYLALSPIWETHRQFWVEEGDPIPPTFNRNASAHAVSETQYTLTNALQSVLFASTLIYFIDQEALRELHDTEAGGRPPLSKRWKRLLLEDDAR